MFNTPQQAADELVDAAEKFDVHALEEIFGPDDDVSSLLVNTRRTVSVLPIRCRGPQKKSVSWIQKKGSRAFLLVGDEDWPFPVPL